MIDCYPRISIITPSFNQGAFLEQAIRSVIVQNYPNLEYVIIDGGSTDNSIEIIKKYEKHLHYWISEKDNGQYDAIGIWDYHGYCVGFGSSPGFSREAFLDGCYLPRGRKGLCWIQQESTFWRRSVWEKTGGYIDTQYTLAGDFDLWSRFYYFADLYGVCSPLAGFRKRLNQRSKDKKKYFAEADKSLNAMRMNLKWRRPDRISKTIFPLKLHRMQILRAIIRTESSYKGIRVIRNNYHLPNGNWLIESYRFGKTREKA